MARFFDRARRLFDYSDLEGNNTSASVTASSVSGASSITIDNASSGMASANAMYKRKRRALLIACCLFGLVAVFIVATTVKHKQNMEEALKKLPNSLSSATAKMDGTSRGAKSLGQDKLVRLDHVVQGRFHPSNLRFNGTWVSDREFMYESLDRGLVLVNLDHWNGSRIMSRTHLHHYGAYDHFLSADKQYLMLQLRPEKVFRRSTLSEFVILPLKYGRTSTSQIVLKPTSDMSNRPFQIRYASFAPAGNALVYVDRGNNIYFRRSVMDQDEKLTDTGEERKLFNGIPDWVFEEEVFEDNKALWWAPDGQKLVWGVFNDTEVESYLLQDYGSWKHVDQYPYIQDVPYPKVDRANPTVELWLANFQDGGITKRQIPPPRSLANQEAHFSYVTWAGDNHFAVHWMNRVQNVTVVSLCATEGLDDCVEIFANEEQDGPIDYKYRLHFEPGWQWSPEKPVPDFVTVLAAPFVNHHFRQVVLVSNYSRAYLTKLEADVMEITTWSNDNYVYYVSTLPGRPGTRQLYRVPSPKMKTNDVQPTCLTCNNSNALMASLNREPCQYHSISMSPGSSYYAMTCQGPDVPYACLHRTADNKLIKIYEDNSRLIKRMSGFQFPTVHTMEVPVSDWEQKAQVKLYLPPNFDENQPYPTLVYVYGGPGNQQVGEQFNQFDYQTYLSGAKGFVYVIIDPVGSGGQGDDWRHATYRRFGTVEVQSTIEVTRYLQRHLPYVDAERTAIWGWSYGGFLSLSVLGQDSAEDGVFRCGASVAPVADWTLYDTYYTERYMGLSVGDNEQGYNRSRVFNHLDNLRSKPFYLLHGTHDDNVHYQQSMLISAALESKDILFRQQAYPDQDHSIGSYQRHLYHSLTDFFLNDCFEERKTK